MTMHSLKPEIVQKLIDGGPTYHIQSAFTWADTPEGPRYWLAAKRLDKLTDEHITKLQNILDSYIPRSTEEPEVEVKEPDLGLDAATIIEVFDAFLKQSIMLDPPSGYQICARCYNWDENGHKDDCIVPRAKIVQEKLLKGV